MASGRPFAVKPVSLDCSGLFEAGVEDNFRRVRANSGRTRGELVFRIRSSGLAYVAWDPEVALCVFWSRSTEGARAPELMSTTGPLSHCAASCRCMESGRSSEAGGTFWEHSGNSGLMNRLMASLPSARAWHGGLVVLHGGPCWAVAP